MKQNAAPWAIRIATVALVVVVSSTSYLYWKSSQLDNQRSLIVEKWREDTAKVNDVLNQFNDIVELLDAVPPNQTAPYVEKLQMLNRALNNTEFPGCFDSWDKLNAPDEMIAAHLDRIKDPSDPREFYQRKFAAERSLREITSALKKDCSIENTLTKSKDWLQRGYRVQ